MSNCVCKKIGIVILNYNTYELTINLIKNIRTVLDQTDIDIIVVDNASPNNSDKILRESSSELNFVYIGNKENGGYAKGNNIGIKKAIEVGCEYILIANNDIEFIQSDTLGILVGNLEKDLSVGVVTPALVSKDMTPDPPIYYKKPSFFDFTFGCYKFHKKRLRQNIDDEYAIYAPRGSCMLLRSRDLHEIGFLDENTFLYFEEPILAEKLNGIGKHSLFVGQVKVIHNHGKTISSNINKSDTINYILDSLKYYLKEYRHYGWFSILVCELFRKIIFSIKHKL